MEIRGTHDSYIPLLTPPPDGGQTENVGDGPPPPINIFDLLTMVASFLDELRSDNRQARQQDLEQKCATLLKAAEQVRDSAQDKMTFAVAGAAVSMLGGILSSLGAAYNLGQTAGALKLAGPNSPNGISPEAFTVLTAKGSAWSGLTEALSKVMSPTGQILQASGEYQAAGHDEAKLNLDAQAELYETKKSDSGDSLAKTQEDIRKVADAISSIEEKQHEARATSIRNMV